MVRCWRQLLQRLAQSSLRGVAERKRCLPPPSRASPEHCGFRWSERLGGGHRGSIARCRGWSGCWGLWLLRMRRNFGAPWQSRCGGDPVRRSTLAVEPSALFPFCGFEILTLSFSLSLSLSLALSLSLSREANIYVSDGFGTRNVWWSFGGWHMYCGGYFALKDLSKTPRLCFP